MTTDTIWFWCAMMDYIFIALPIIPLVGGICDCDCFKPCRWSISACRKTYPGYNLREVQILGNC